MLRYMQKGSGETASFFVFFCEFLDKAHNM